MQAIIIKGLPDRFILRILPNDIDNKELTYANINTVLFVPIENGKTLVAFDNKSEWNYITDIEVENLFMRIAGLI